MVMRITGVAENGFHILNTEQLLFHGHRKRKMWLLTADRQRAVVYNIKKTISAKNYRKKTRSLGIDSQNVQDLELVANAEAECTPVAAGVQKNRNRTMASSGSVPFASNPRDRENHQDDKIFIRDLAEWLDQAEKAQAFDQLIVAAAPRTQGDLREILTPNVQKRVLVMVPKELTTMTATDIARFLKTEINLPLI